MSFSRVKVAVRVRPFTAAEKALDSQGCVFMQDNVTVLCRGSERRQFTYDYSLWSHDGFVVEEEVYFKSTDESKYQDQTAVFEAIGQPALHNAIKGFNACVFAYGQTGSGKSYTMVGNQANPGLIPLFCQELFSWSDEIIASNRNLDIEVQIFEIYNEHLADLLSEEQPEPAITVQETPAGVYIDGLVSIKVRNYHELEQTMTHGNSRRTQAATVMNDTSSRAHTIYRLVLTQTAQRSGEVLNSEVNLVDLAGSERVGETGVTGVRFQEGTHINLSLSNLRAVISALTSNHAHVPYRDSQLTFILKNALGGNSKTAMVATISPALLNYSQTLSTLRYAQQVKFIENAAVVNLSVLNPETARLRDSVALAKEQLSVRETLISQLNDELETLRKGLESDLNDRSSRLPHLSKASGSSSVKRSCACIVF